MKRIFKDWKANTGNIKARCVLVLFRIAQIGKLNKFSFFLMIPYLIFYRIMIEWILNIELPYKVEIGRGFKLHHGHAVVINDGCIIGDNCTMRHCTTIGNKKMRDGQYSKCPMIGDNVDIGSNVVIIGPISIGNNAVIGAGAVVVKNVPNNSVVVGNPAKIIS